jgi:hypothetical protein
MANIFISHRSTDTSQAEKLASDLRNAGHWVWLDEWVIGLGDSITGKMNEGLSGSAYVVLCLSSSSVTSPWMSREWLSALARQLNGQNVKLLPVRLSGGDIPPIIADLKYADAVKDYQVALAELLKAVW